MRPPRLPYRPPQSERHHYVFVDPCGCPFGLIEASASKPGGPPCIADEDQAWDQFYDTRAVEREARKRGVRAQHVTHEQYERDYFDQMHSGRCTHGEAS